MTNSNLAKLFTYASRLWSVGPSVSQTLFDFGRRNANVLYAQANYDAAVAAYRETVLTAFQQVEDNLSNLRVLAQEAQEPAAPFRPPRSRCSSKPNATKPAPIPI